MKKEQAKIGFKKYFRAILRGELIMTLDPGRYIIHILYCFLLIGIAIWISMMIDSTMTKVELNKTIIDNQEVEIAMKTFEVTSLERRSGIEERLEKMGSKVRDSRQPVIYLD